MRLAIVTPACILHQTEVDLKKQHSAGKLLPANTHLLSHEEFEQSILQ